VSRVTWVSGASSGIGAAFADVASDHEMRVINVSRRPHPNPHIEHLRVDLSNPEGWREVERHFDAVLALGETRDAMFVHCAGTLTASGSLLSVDADAYLKAVLLNAASGQVLGQAFLSAASRAGCQSATMVTCSAPSASQAAAGMSHYCGGKAALEHWTRAVGIEMGDGEGAPRVFSVVPYCVDTPMLREMISTSPEEIPVAALFRDAAGRDVFATPAEAAQEIWAGIDRGLPQGATLTIGAPDALNPGDIHSESVSPQAGRSSPITQ
jgi:benzil reductase ((S)-benzoin forming)